MKVAVLGGSFDPIHNGHISLAKQVMQICGLNQILFIPCFQHPFRKTLSSAHDRFAMTKLLEDKVIKVSDIEIKKQNISYSIDTLLELQRKFPDDSFVFIIGSDQISNFPKWKDFRKIIDDFGLIVVPRNTNDNIKLLVEQTFGSTKNITVLTPDIFSVNTISSSQIRKNIKQHESIENLVPKLVESYIIEHNLYK